MPTTGGRSSGKSARAPPCSSSSSQPVGARSGSWGSPPPTCTVPEPAARKGVRTFLRTQEVTAVTGVHIVRLPSAPPDEPRGPRALSPAPDRDLLRDVWAAWLIHLPPQCRWRATGPRPHRANATAGSPSHSSPAPRGALQSTAHGTPQMHQEVVKRACLQPRMPTRITVMSDSDGSPQRDDSHHRCSRSRSPVSLGCAGETLAERDERRLAEAAVPIGRRAGQPRAATADPEPSTQGPAPAGETAPAARAASPAVPPPEGTPGARGSETAAPASRATAPTAAAGTLSAPGLAVARAPERLARSRRSRSGGQGGREVPRQHPHQPSKAVPPQGRLP